MDSFLLAPTPQEWVDVAIQNENVLLIDHANCERKAASSALSMIYQFIDRSDCCLQLSQLVREEMRHFEQVVELLKTRGQTHTPLGPSRYAKSLHKYAISTGEKLRVDELLIAAIIEARSNERFRLLIPVLSDDISILYGKLEASEARHANIYLELAKSFVDEHTVEGRLSKLLAYEEKLVTSKDKQFRFHSGLPSSAKHSSVKSSIN